MGSTIVQASCRGEVSSGAVGCDEPFWGRNEWRSGYIGYKCQGVDRGRKNIFYHVVLFTYLCNMETVPQKNTRRKERMSYEQAFSLNGGNKPPQAIDLEEAVLGALMLDANALNTAVDLLHEEFFYKPEHQAIFRAIRKLFERNQPVDMMTVTNQLRQSGELEAAGGAFHISELTSHIVSAAHIEYYARVLSEKYISRELIRISTETISSAYDETTDVVDLLDKTEGRLMDINEKNFRTDYRPIGDLVHEAHDQIVETAENKGSTSGIPSGFIELDKMTAGFQPGTLIILAARPAMGKTACALSMARNIAVEQGKPVAFFSLEMTGVELAMRLISAEAQIAGDKLKKGDLRQDELVQLEARTQRLNEAKIFIDDTPQLTIYELRAKCRRLKDHHDIQMVFIDYLQLMSAGNDTLNRNGNREQEISTISRQLKALSKELGIPVLAMAQLSRAVETRGGEKKPMLSDLRESGAIEQDADIVMFIYRPEYYGILEDGKGSTAGMADIILAKHRSGGVGEARLRFVGKYARFENDDFSANGQIAGALAQNTSFDSASGVRTVLVNSKINRDNGNIDAGFQPDGDAPF